MFVYLLVFAFIVLFVVEILDLFLCLNFLYYFCFVFRLEIVFVSTVIVKMRYPRGR